MRCSASRVSIHVRDAAFPSTTSSGISVDGDADHVLQTAQLVDRDVDLLRRSNELELERAIGLVLEGASRMDVQTDAAEDVLDRIEAGIAMDAHGRVHLATARQHASLNGAQANENEND